MRSRILRCPECRKYTLRLRCPECRIHTEHTFPPRFSPEDRWSRYRMQDRGLDEMEETHDAREE